MEDEPTNQNQPNWLWHQCKFTLFSLWNNKSCFWWIDCPILFYFQNLYCIYKIIMSFCGLTCEKITKWAEWCNVIKWGHWSSGEIS
jgi:hypothetical protein